MASALRNSQLHKVEDIYMDGGGALRAYPLPNRLLQLMLAEGGKEGVRRCHFFFHCVLTSTLLMIQ